MPVPAPNSTAVLFCQRFASTDMEWCRYRVSTTDKAGTNQLMSRGPSSGR